MEDFSLQTLVCIINLINQYIMQFVNQLTALLVMQFKCEKLNGLHQVRMILIVQITLT